MHFRGSCFHESFHAVVGAPTEVHGLQAATISSECTSVEASMSSVEEELITSMEASRDYFRVSFHLRRLLSLKYN